jgi:uncharacterized glyoxalase superfamily protein PhnB
MVIKELFAYLCIADAGRAIEFYTKAFGAKEKMRLTEPSGRIGHAELDFGGTTVMLADEFPECGITGPKPGMGTPVTIHIHVDNADDVIQRAVSAGATLERAPKDEFPAQYATPSAIAGPSAIGSRMCRRRKCSGDTRLCSRWSPRVPALRQQSIRAAAAAGIERTASCRQD